MDAPSSTGDPERGAAEFVSALSLEDVPQHVADRARLTVADSLAAIVGGADATPVPDLADHWDDGGRAAVPGLSVETTPLRAAILGGTAGTALEIDSGHRYAGGHPPMYLLPALLADAEVADRSGESLLAGFVAGYETCARTGIATELDAGYHPHGVVGAVGAAAALSRAREYDAEDALAAMRVAAGGAQHGRFEAALEGVPNAYAGIGNARGLVAADQAAAGFGGLDRGIARHLELATADGSVDASVLVEGLGTRWEVDRGYFKLHAACRFTHSALDALAMLQSRRRLDSDDVESVTVRTYPLAARLDEPRPANPYEAKFSVPFAVATRLVRGSSGRAAFAEAALTDDTYALADRVTVEATEEMADRLPDERGARVTVRTTDGTEYDTAVRNPRGGPARPVSADTLRGKFDSLVAPVLGDDGADRLWRAVHDLPETDAGTVVDLARP